MQPQIPNVEYCPKGQFDVFMGTLCDAEICVLVGFLSLFMVPLFP